MLSSYRWYNTFDYHGAEHFIPVQTTKAYNTSFYAISLHQLWSPCMIQIIAGITQELYMAALLPCFLSFVRNLSKIRSTNDSGEILLAVTLT